MRIVAPSLATDVMSIAQVEPSRAARRGARSFPVDVAAMNTARYPAAIAATVATMPSGQ